MLKIEELFKKNQLKIWILTVPTNNRVEITGCFYILQKLAQLSKRIQIKTKILSPEAMKSFLHAKG